MHYHFDSADSNKMQYKLPKEKGKKIVSFEVVGTSLESFQFPNIRLAVRFEYQNNKSFEQTIVFSEAITHGFVPDQGVSIVPIKVIPDAGIQEDFSIEELNEVTIKVVGSGDFNFTIDIDIDYIEVPMK